MKKEETTNKVDLIFYTRPFHRQKYGGWVYDARGNFVFQFKRKFNKEDKFDENGELIARRGSHVEGAIELEDAFIFSLNALDHEPIEQLNLSVHVNDCGIILNNEKEFITIRGWGNLTGTGAHNFPPEKAAHIQDSFRDWLIFKTTKK